MHFCVSAARVSLPGTAPAHLLTSALRWPRKMGTNWFMPALVKSRFGESGMRLDDGTMVCCFDLKKSRNDWRIWTLVIMANVGRARCPQRAAGVREPSAIHGALGQRALPQNQSRGIYGTNGGNASGSFSPLANLVYGKSSSR